MKLTPCPDCRRHVRDVEALCPFCGARVERLCARASQRLPKRSLVFASAFVIGACATSSSGDDGNGLTVDDVGAETNVETSSSDTADRDTAETVDTANVDTRTAEDTYTAPDTRFDTGGWPDTAAEAGFDALCVDAADADGDVGLPACIHATDSAGDYVVCDTSCYAHCDCAGGGGWDAEWYGRGHCTCTPGACYGAPPPPVA
jgi:hypothetical protein